MRSIRIIVSMHSTWAKINRITHSMEARPNIQSDNIVHVLLRYPLRLTRSSKAALWCWKSILGTAYSSNQGRGYPTGRYRNLNILRRARYNLFWQIRDVYSARLILVAFRDNLNDLVSRLLCSLGGINCVLTSMISSRGNSRNGISAALHAMR